MHVLQDKTLKLEQMLAERDLKIEQLTGQLKAASSATSAAPPSVPSQDIVSGPSEEGGRTPANSTFDGMSDLKLEFQGQIMKLQQYIEANNLRHVDPSGAPFFVFYPQTPQLSPPPSPTLPPNPCCSHDAKQAGKGHSPCIDNSDFPLNAS